LSSLTLEGNPIAVESNYRSFIKETLPKLQYLDDTPINTELDPDEELLKKEKSFLQQSIKFSRIESVENLAISQSPVVVSMTPRQSATELIDRAKRPSSSMGYFRPTSPGSPKSNGSARPRTPVQLSPRPGTASARPGSSMGNSFSAVNPKNMSQAKPQSDASSDLTFGSKQVICGNPVKSLRSRKIEREETIIQQAPELDNDNLLMHVMQSKSQEASPASDSLLEEIEADEMLQAAQESNQSNTTAARQAAARLRKQFSKDTTQSIQLHSVPIVDEIFPLPSSSISSTKSSSNKRSPSPSTSSKKEGTLRIDIPKRSGSSASNSTKSPSPSFKTPPEAEQRSYLSDNPAQPMVGRLRPKRAVVNKL